MNSELTPPNPNPNPTTPSPLPFKYSPPHYACSNLLTPSHPILPVFVSYIPLHPHPCPLPTLPGFML